MDIFEISVEILVHYPSCYQRRNKEFFMIFLNVYLFHKII